MKKSHFKYIIGIALILISGAMHIIFFDNDEKYDVYLYYDHERYLTNILYDVSVLTEFSVLTYFCIALSKRVWRPIFIFSIMQWFFYFAVYRQMWTLIGLPILTILYYYEFRTKR